MFRIVSLSLVALVLINGSAASRADNPPATQGNIVCLTVREPDPLTELERTMPMLARELVRQAFLIAARDELGLLTRDKTLREAFPPPTDPRLQLFEMSCRQENTSDGVELQYALNQQTSGTPKTVWEWKTQAQAMKTLANLPERAEALSRGELKDVLAKLGLGKPVPAARKTGDIPTEASDLLWEWNELAVLGALRRVHGEIREHGESPELLGALVVGYANLGTLTEYYLSPAYKAFAARALIYSERLVQRTEGSAWALWHRAYARALPGLHSMAEADVKAAKEKQSKSPDSQAVPFWTEVLDTYCQGKYASMLQAANSLPQRRLARWLHMIAVMPVQNGDSRMRVAQAVVDLCPDCYRSWDALCVGGPPGVMKSVSDRTFPSFGQTFRKRLPDVPGMPEPLAKQLRDAEAPEKVEEEIDLRLRLVAELKTAANDGHDSMEPSLAALGQMLEEIEFKQLRRRVELMFNENGLPANETVASFEKLVERHPYALTIKGFGADSIEQGTSYAQELLKRIDPSELEYPETELVRWVEKCDQKRAIAWLRLMYQHADYIYRDAVLGVDYGAAGSPDKEVELNNWYMRMIWKASSRSPAVIAIEIERNWKAAEPLAAQFEKEYGDDPLILAALSRQFAQNKRFDDAERCAKKRMSVVADYSGYQTLAFVYEKKGDVVRFKETLEKALDLPDLGSRSAAVLNQIAQFHMSRKEWEDALPYADQAAESGEAWPQLTAARCHEMVEDWDQAEELTQTVAENYLGYALQWMLFCHRTGRGDEQAADECARQYVESFETWDTDATLEQIGVYSLIMKQPQDALTAFHKAARDGKNAHTGLHAALVADTLGDAATRDALLRQIDEKDKKKPRASEVNGFAELARLMQRALQSGNVKDFDLQQVDRIIAAAAKQEPATTFEYFVGVFLKNRSDSENSRRYLIRSAQSDQYSVFNHVLACQMLRDDNIFFDPADAPAAEKKK